MWFGVLGPLEVRAGGRWIALGGPQRRVLLAMLLLEAGQVVSVDRLADGLWGDRPPDAARALVQGCVAQLRRVLRTEPAGSGRQPLITRPPGYLLQVGPGELDLHRLRELEEQAEAALQDGSGAGLDRAAELLAAAFGLWRGPVLRDIDAPSVRAEAVRLEEHRLVLLERRVDLALRLGRYAEPVGELRATVAAHPLRERLWGQLMTALYCSGRQADALAAYRELRGTLVGDLGVEPNPGVQQLERLILSGAAATDVVRQHVGEPVEPAARRAPAAGEPVRTAERPPESPAGPAQLPATVVAFTGRSRQLRTLDRLLAGAGGPAAAVPISVVAGTAGVGKTALAVHWAHRVRDRFPDGQLHVDLRGYALSPPMRPVEALTGFLHALGVPAHRVPADQEEAAGLYRSQLAGRRMLVLLDNARGADQVRPLLPGTPGCVVLITSREALGGLVARDGATHLTLDELTPAEARALLVRILGRDRIRAEPRAAAELARACGYLPLALRIAGANLTLRPAQRIAAHVAELAGNRLAKLAVADDEQAAVRAAFDLSYAVLDGDSRMLFRRLGLVPGPDVTAAAAAALIARPVEETRRLLGRLSGAHLLHQLTPGRYALHDLLRLYAAERVEREEPAGDRDAATRRLLDWYLRGTDRAARQVYPNALRLAEPAADPVAGSVASSAAEPVAGSAVGSEPGDARLDDRTDALAWLDAELANLRAAIRQATDRGPRPVGWLLADNLRGYFWLRLYTADWLAVAESALTAAQAERDVRAQAAARLSLGDARLLQARYPEAIEHYHGAARCSQRSGWREGLATANNGLGNAHMSAGRPLQAADHFARALAGHRQTGWLTGQATAHGSLGNACRILGRLAESADHFGDALALFGRLGSPVGEATALGALGEVRHALGQLGAAREPLDHALTLLRQIGDRGGEAYFLRALADLHCDAGRHADALACARAAATLARETDEPRLVAPALTALGHIHRRLGQLGEAVAAYQEGLELAEAAGLRYAEATALAGLAGARRQLAEHELARSAARQAVEMARTSGFRVVEGVARAVLADIELALGRPGDAVEQASEALELHRAAGHRPGAADTLLLLGDALAGLGDTEGARTQRARAVVLLTEMELPEAGRVQRPVGLPERHQPAG